MSMLAGASWIENFLSEASLLWFLVLIDFEQVSQQA